MGIKILVFGGLVDIVGEHSFYIKDVSDTNTLLDTLNEKFPLLRDRKFVVSVDKKITTENTEIHPASEIALLPPFSGG